MNPLQFDFRVDKPTKTVFIDREFNAELSLVWDAFTKQEILDQWWAPKPLLCKTKIMEFNVGGRRFYSMIWPEGQEFWGIQKYTLIEPETDLAWLSSFTDGDENINEALPTSQWNLNFSEQNGLTKVSITVYNDSLENLEKVLEMGFKEGFTATLNELDNLLSTLNK